MNSIIKLFACMSFLILISGCSGSVRFTSDNDLKKSESDEKQTTNSIPSNLDEYSDYPVLETKEGVASFYANKYNGKKTANGEIYDMNDLTAAHLFYPFNTVLRVINKKNNRSVILRINDRQPEDNGRIIDVSLKAAEILGMKDDGLAAVILQVLKWGEH